MLSSDPLYDPAVFGAPSAQSGRGPLHAGAVWEGLQQSGRNSYKVKVIVETVDIEAGTLCGLLEIHGLTPHLDSLVTFFDGEIIGTRAGFVTGRWGATEADDMKHWNRFAPFRTLKHHLKGPGMTYNHMNRPFLFMRWKERFVVPDQKIQNINGASYSGFYFLCLEFNDQSATSLGPPTTERGRLCHHPSPRRASAPPPPQPMSPPPQPTTLPSPIPIPSERPNTLRTRSGSRSAGTVSYAAAVANGTSSFSPPASPSLGEVEDSMSALHVDLSAKDGVPFITHEENTSDTSVRSNAMSEDGVMPMPIAIHLPIPIGTTEEDFPAPSSPPPPSHLMRRVSHGSESTVVREHREREREREYARERKRDSKSTWGVREPMSTASITGWYFFKHSEPFQQLSLRYVPQYNGGSQAFSFR